MLVGGLKAVNIKDFLPLDNARMKYCNTHDVTMVVSNNQKIKTDVVTTSKNTCTNKLFTGIKLRTVGCLAFFVLRIFKGLLMFLTKDNKHQTSCRSVHTFLTGPCLYDHLQRGMKMNYSQ